MRLEQFTLKDMARCGSEVRELAPEVEGLEAVAGLVARNLYERFVGKNGQKECVLVRIFRTQRYRDLDPVLQRLVNQRVACPREDMNCLVLLGTAGVEAAWDSPSTSQKHRVIPLADRQMLEAAPMFAGLFQALGVDLDRLVRPPEGPQSPPDGRKFGIFHVAEAQGNPLLPAQQEFVLPYKVRSVIGFGGYLGGEDSLFATVIFSRVPIPPESAELFRPLSLSVRMRLEKSQGGHATRDFHSELLTVYEQSISEQYDRLNKEQRQRERRFAPILRQRAEHLAERQLAEPRLHRVPDHLVARAGALQLAVPTTHLLGVASPPVTPVPLAPAELLGVTTFQGQVWPVIQLRAGTDSNWLLFWREPFLALRVDSLLGLGWVESDRLSPPPPVVLPRSLRCVGLTSENWLVLEPASQ